MPWFNSRIGFSAALLAAAGCTTPSPRFDPAQLRDRTIAVVRLPMPEFTELTPGWVPVRPGMDGGVFVPGSELVRGFGLTDPAYGVADAVASELAGRSGARYVGLGEAVVDGETAAAVAARYRDVDLALEVSTRTWGFAHLPSTRARYRTAYAARLRLIETATARVLVQMHCRALPAEEEPAFSYDQLFADHAARLRIDLERRAARCAAELVRWMLGS